MQLDWVEDMKIQDGNVMSMARSRNMSSISDPARNLHTSNVHTAPFRAFRNIRSIYFIDTDFVSR